MPFVRAADGVVHDMHESRFTSYAAPARGSEELCAWRVEIPAGSQGVPHTVSHEEILLVLGGTLRFRLSDPDGPGSATAGDVVVIPPGATVQVGNPGDETASAWVTTSVGLEATLPDGATISPPWVR